MHRKKDQNRPILLIGLCVYLSMLAYFAYQTWQFVSWLFPDDYAAWRIISVLFFDGAAFLWGYVHTCYRFHTREGKQTISWGWGITFFLSFIASVLSMVLAGYYRFHVPVSPTFLGLGYAVTIFAVVYSILTAMGWLLPEWKAMHPHMDYFEESEQIAENSLVSLENTATSQLSLPPPGNNGHYQAMPRNTRQRAASLAIIGKYGRETVLGNLEIYAKEAGVDRKTLKRYALQEGEMP